MPILDERYGGIAVCRVSGGRRRDKEGRGHAESSRTPEGLIYCSASTCETMNAAGRTAGGACKRKSRGGVHGRSTVLSRLSYPRSVESERESILRRFHATPAEAPKAASSDPCVCHGLHTPPYVFLPPSLPPYFIHFHPSSRCSAACPHTCSPRHIHDDLLYDARVRLRRTDDVRMLATAPMPRTRRDTLLQFYSLLASIRTPECSNPGTYPLSTEPTALVAAL